MFNSSDIRQIQEVADECRIFKIQKTSLLTNSSTVDVRKKLFILEYAVSMMLGVSMWGLVGLRSI